MGYQICANCVMDTSDPKIKFDAEGVCDHCLGFEKDVRPNWHPNEKGHTIFKEIVARIKRKGTKQEFDCIMGMSGGL